MVTSFSSFPIQSLCISDISSFISFPDELDPDTSLVLVNAVYFKGKWATPFDKNNTTLRPFTLVDGTKKEVEMMHILSEFRYGVLDELDGAQFLELPYEVNIS